MWTLMMASCVPTMPDATDTARTPTIAAPDCDAAEVPYDGIDNDCDPDTPDDDLDGDGHRLVDDCDDTDPVVHLEGVWPGDLPSAKIGRFCVDHCTRSVEGSVFIHDGAALDRLGCLGAVGGTLAIYQTKLTSLEGLEHLESVGDLQVVGNPGLTSLEGLDRLQTAGSVRIDDNQALISLDGLDALQRMSGRLSIGTDCRFEYVRCHLEWSEEAFGNDALVDISALGQLTALHDVVIGDNERLTSLAGLEGLTTIDGTLHVVWSAGLTSLAGLSNVTQVGDLIVDRNWGLTTLDLRGLSVVEGDVAVFGERALTSLGLPALTEIGGDLSLVDTALPDLTSLEPITRLGGLTLGGNDQLTTLSALGALSAVDGVVTLQGNDVLPSLVGLEGLTAVQQLSLLANDQLQTVAGLGSLRTITGYLQIERNPVLAELEPLHGLESVGAGVEIHDNASLTDDAAWALVHEVGTVGGDVNISGN